MFKDGFWKNIPKDFTFLDNYIWNKQKCNQMI